ncbi:MAG: hypothetical protein IPH40_10715 [Polaromonas sp.]|nr:hypothetical protein [Polaromonas sp.]
MDTSLLSAPAFQAALLAAAGAIAYWLKDIPALLVSWGKRFFISSMTVDSRDKFLFGALVEYMDEHPALRRVNQFTARTVLVQQHQPKFRRRFAQRESAQGVFVTQ